MSVSLGRSPIDGILAASFAIIGCRQGRSVPELSRRTSSGDTGLDRSYFYTQDSIVYIGAIEKVRCSKWLLARVT